MSNETNVDVTTETPQALKSNDTLNAADVTVKVEAKPEPKAEPKAEVAKQETPPEGDDAPDADSPQAKQKRLPRWMKERLERERQTTEARTREAVLRELQEQQRAQEPPKVEQPARKTLEDFDFDQDAYTDYLVEQKIQQAEERRTREAEQRKQAEAAESFKKRIDAFEERAGDGAWEDVIESPINMDKRFKPLTDLFMGDDHDLDIAHYLATNLKEAERIRDLPRLSQIREIAKIAEQFDGSTRAVDTPAEPPSKKTTSAPPPVKTVSGAGKPSVDINDPNLTTEQRIALWRKKKAG